MTTVFAYNCAKINLNPSINDELYLILSIHVEHPDRPLFLISYTHVM